MRSKTALFPDDLAEMADFAKALSHPARLAILQTLAARGTCICGEVVEVLPLAQATVSQHLKALKEAGLVQGTIDGPRTCYCIDAEAVRALGDRLTAFFGTLAEADPSCC